MYSIRYSFRGAFAPQFANEDNLDFDDVSDKTPTQEFDVAQGREVGEYAVKYVDFIMHHIMFSTLSVNTVLMVVWTLFPQDGEVLERVISDFVLPGVPRR